MYISVIIPTRNRASLIEKAILSFKDQTYPLNNFEIIIIDNGSTDETESVVKSHIDYLNNMSYISKQAPGLHVGRHAGLEIAKGDILVYADDDIEAFPTWLEGIAESFEDPSVALVGGNNLPRYETPPPPWIEELWGSTPYGKANGMYSILDFSNSKKEISPYYVWGCNFSIRKGVLLEVGGFHPDGMPDDLLKYRGDGESAVSYEIIKRGYKTVFNPRASVYHYVPKNRMTLEYIHKRGYIQGISDSYTLIRKHGGIPFMKNSKKYIAYLFFWARIQIRLGSKYKENPHELFRKGWWEGFFYHQREVTNNADLLLWVLREDYFGVNGVIK